MNSGLTEVLAAIPRGDVTEVQETQGFKKEKKAPESFPPSIQADDAL
jgi:hypothetical protein